jgi:orotidine-5'-phosphate decarboxylase
MVELFGERLAARVAQRGPLCVGIDPRASLLRDWGRSDGVEGLEFCALRLVEVAAETAVAVKPQVAFFERFGAAGYRALERVIAEAHEADLLCVADAKRGDIPATNEGYAEAWLSPRSPLASDAVTVHPYLGPASLAPFVEAARSFGRGFFVLVATSNDEGREVQAARGPDGRLVEDLVLEAVAALNGREDGRGSVGVVLGATRERPAVDLAVVGGPVLVPGVGAQGASAADVARLTERCARASVVANVARAIAGQGPERGALVESARRWRDDLAAALL